MAGDPANVWWTVIVLILVGVVVGAVNGLLISRLKINPLIATLGVGLILKGLLNAMGCTAGSCSRAAGSMAG